MEEELVPRDDDRESRDARGDGEGLQAHDANDPNSALGAQVGNTLNYSPQALPAGVASAGEIGILGSAVNAFLNVSVTNFTNDATRCESPE